MVMIKNFWVFFSDVPAKKKTPSQPVSVLSLACYGCDVFFFFLKVLFNVKSNIFWMKQFEFLSHSQYIFFFEM